MGKIVSLSDALEKIHLRSQERKLGTKPMELYDRYQAVLTRNGFRVKDAPGPVSYTMCKVLYDNVDDFEHYISQACEAHRQNPANRLNLTYLISVSKRLT